MNPDEIKEWLEPEEKGICQAYLDYFSDLDEHPERSQAFTDAVGAAKTFLESLAACRKHSEQRRELMEKHQYQKLGNSFFLRCIECDQRKDYYCKPDCLWAQAIHTDGPSGTIKGE